MIVSPLGPPVDARPTSNPPLGAEAAHVHVVSAQGESDRLDLVSIEEPLEIRLSYGPAERRRARTIAVTMRTPGHDVDLALGFLFAEGVLSSMNDVQVAAHAPATARESRYRNQVRVHLRPEVSVDLSRLRRSSFVSSSCGVCGKISIDATRAAGCRPLPDDGCTISRKTLCELPDRLRQAQPTFAATGGLHAAALFDCQGRLQRVREDVGRHNALDKLIGAELIRGALPLGQRLILVSGRASFELVQKAIRAGAVMLAAVGAPSTLAAAMAQEYGLSLVGFLRPERFNVYSAPQRVSC